MTNVFGVENSVGRKLRDAWEQYVRSQYANINVGSVNCGASATQSQAETGRQNAVNAFSQLAQKLGAAAPQLVQVQWQYQQSAAAPPARPAAPAAGSAYPAQAASKNAGAAGTNVAKSPQQSFDQSLQSMENTSTGTVTGAATTVSDSVNGSVQQGINRLFHKHGSTSGKPAAKQPAESDNLLASSGKPLVMPGTAPDTQAGTAAPGQALAANPAPASAAPTQPDSGMSIQDEGDGKHFLLITAGKADAQELTLQEGSKNVYIDETTGDKYVVMANGKIIRVPHKPASKDGK